MILLCVEVGFSLINTAFKIQLLSALVIKCRGKFRIFQFLLAMHQQKNCQRPNRNLCISHQQWLQHKSVICQGLWFGFLNLLILPILYCLLRAHLNGRSRSQYFSWWSPCLGFFVCPSYNRRTHWMLKKPGAQNMTACENQGKQCKLSDHWKSFKKPIFLKVTKDDTKKTKRFTEIQVLTKRFTTRVFKETRKRK